MEIYCAINLIVITFSFFHNNDDDFFNESSTNSTLIHHHQLIKYQFPFMFISRKIVWKTPAHLVNYCSNLS